MMSRDSPFHDTTVFLSRNLVPPEVFDALHDALRLNGATVFLCCDPSRNGPRDFHVISSPSHEKFQDLRAKGCKLLGPQCVISCSKERRSFPDQDYTCCLAMDGVKILASGFEMAEKVEIEKLVSSMGGDLHSKTSADISFVIVKNVLAAKYQWSSNVLKKPPVTINWLYQCRDEHRIVPQEPYRILPFTGLTICVTRLLADERKEIQQCIVQNGGKYLPDLTRTCTHLISNAAEGDKYKVAKRWGHIHIVSRKWLDQSIARKGCLNEDSYPVPGIHVPSTKVQGSSVAALENHDNQLRSSQSFTTSAFGDPKTSADPAFSNLDPDLETTVSQTLFSDTQLSNKEDACEMIYNQPNERMNQDDRVAQDSEAEDDGLYLSECRLMLVGFDSLKLRSLVTITRKGGASRYTTSNERLTHIIVGCPSESEKKEVRGLASLGLIHVVRSSWLEECDRERREVPVLQKHIAFDLLLPKGSIGSNSGTTTITQNMNLTSDYCSLPRSVSYQPVSNREIEDKLLEGQVEKTTLDRGHCHDESAGLSQQIFSDCITDNNNLQKKKINCYTVEKFSCTVFRGIYFCFSETFPDDRRPEIVDWVNQGGGKFLSNLGALNPHYIIECHGAKAQVDIRRVTYVSSHWIRSCLEDGSLLDVGSHILYSPLPCQVPLPRFESFRFCVSQYEAKDRQLLRNLCFTLGAKFVEKLTKKVTHLLCKFSSGDKYDAACRWGITVVTSEWISECAMQNRLVPLDRYRPKEVSAHDVGLYTISQSLSQAMQIRSVVQPSESPFRSRCLGSTQNSNNKVVRQELDNHIFAKKPRIVEGDVGNDVHLSEKPRTVPVCNEDSFKEDKQKRTKEEADVPDVAAAIEDLLEQTSKIQDMNSPERTLYDINIFPSKPPAVQERLEHTSLIGLSKHWINRTQKNEDAENNHYPSGNGNLKALDGFSETQTESQVVGYEEDLSGRQLIIDRVRVRTQSSMSLL